MSKDQRQWEWLRKSIESVLGQTYPDWELIVVDNGSTDETVSLLEQYQSHQKILVIRYERNSPHTVICNEAIQQARGRYVSILYGDDYYLPSKLERQVGVIETLAPSFGVVYCAGYRLMSSGEMKSLPCGSYQGDILEKLLTNPQFF
jgi:teichuronic acid biosynthesis glycosyltransferase TuaG